MYTQCPDCQTRFRVTAAALRAAHGTVRCGRCGSAFDALVSLADGLEAPSPAPALALEPLVISAPRLAYPPVAEPAADEAASDATEVLVDESRTTETITLEGERVSVDLLSDVPDAAAAEPAAAAATEPTAGPEPAPDLDATDRYEVLRIPESAYPDESDGQRELEALVQRLQRELESPRAAAEEVLDEEAGEATAETAVLNEPATPELTPREPVFVDVTPSGAVTAVLELAPEPRLEPVAVPEPAESLAAEAAVEPAAPVEPEVPPAAGAAPGSTPPVTLPPPVALPAGPTPAAAAAVRVEELPLAARRFRSATVETGPEVEPETGRSAWAALGWGLASLLLALGLAAQAVHHWRDTLARDARTGPVLRLAYERLGLALAPSRDLAAIELRQLGSDERAAGRMVVRASLTNRAAFAQPLPILRLQLEDRYGSMIATRDFEPADYLPEASPAGELLPPGASSAAELLLADPGTDAVGYRLDVCLRDAEGGLRCAQPGPG